MSYQLPAKVDIGYGEWIRWTELSYKDQLGYLLMQANRSADTTKEILAVAKTIAPLYVAEQQTGETKCI